MTSDLLITKLPALEDVEDALTQNSRNARLLRAIREALRKHRDLERVSSELLAERKQRQKRHNR